MGINNETLLYLFHFVGIMRKLSDYVLHSFSKSIIIIERQMYKKEGNRVENTVLGFIGAGNMATAIINGIVSTETMRPSQFAVFDVAAESVDAACHVAYRIGFHAQQVDRQAQRRAASDAWEFRQFSGHVLKQSGHVLGNFWIRRGGSGFRWFRTSSTPSSPFCRRRW